jgi:hypothetical protein
VALTPHGFQKISFCQALFQINGDSGKDSGQNRRVVEHKGSWCVTCLFPLQLLISALVAASTISSCCPTFVIARCHRPGCYRLTV